MAMATAETPQAALYPVRLWMEYPQRLSRLSTFFRIMLAIPVFIFLALIGGGSLNFTSFNSDDARNAGAGGAAIGGTILLAIWVTIVLRQRIPRWLFDFQVAVHRFSYRAFAYFGLLTDKYPAFEGDWVLQYWVDYPERLSRWRVLFWKLITSIPHFVVLVGLNIAAVVVVIIAWFAILITGAFPKGLHTFVVGVMRWNARVTAYFESLTDEFPPFSLDHDAGPGSRSTQTICAVIGGIIFAAMVAGIIALIAFFAVFLGREKSRDVSYSSALSGSLGAAERSIELDDVTFGLASGDDPATPGFLAARPGKRLVQFTIEYEGAEGSFTFGDAGDVGTRKIGDDSVRLETDGDSSIDPVLLTLDGVVAPLRVSDIAAGELVAVFEIDDADDPVELRAYPNADNDRHVAWQFE
jgi:hypothetical protein